MSGRGRARARGRARGASEDQARRPGEQTAPPREVSSRKRQGQMTRTTDRTTKG